MKPMVAVLGLVGVVGLAVAPGGAVAQIAKNVAARSPWGPPDEVGTLNVMTDASQWVSMLEALWLEDLAKDQVCEFLFIASPLKLRRGTASPMRPLAIPIRHE